MKLLVDQINADPAPFAFQGDSAWWAAVIAKSRDLPLELAEPFRFEGEAHQMAENLFVEGNARGAIELECGRCLARYRHGLRESFRLVLEPAGGRSPLEPEANVALARDGLCLGEELESGWYRGHTLQLDAFFAEVVSLGLPVVPLCREECIGLCPQCGVDRNVENCECQETRSDSPFAALAALRGNAGRGR